MFDGREPAKGGSLMVGEGGRKLYAPGDYGRKWELWPAEQFEGYEAPEPTLPRTPSIYAEWLEGCRGGPAPMSNFDHAGPFTEAGSSTTTTWVDIDSLTTSAPYYYRVRAENAGGGE